MPLLSTKRWIQFLSFGGWFQWTEICFRYCYQFVEGVIRLLGGRIEIRVTVNAPLQIVDSTKEMIKKSFYYVFGTPLVLRLKFVLMFRSTNS